MTDKTTIKRIRDHIREKGIIPKRAKKVLHLATTIIDRIPRKGDSTAQKVVKLLSIADAVENTMQVKTTELSTVVERLDLVASTNRVFTSMFFGTRLQDQFEIKRLFLDGCSIIQAVSQEHGMLLFVERWEKSYNPTFYHTKNLDFEKLLNNTWDLYDGRMQFEINWGESTYTTFSTVPNPLYGSDAERMEKMVTRHRRYQVDGMSRAYMFYGAPGTGKTSFAMAFADKVGHRIMRVTARSFSVVSESEIMFIVDAMQPDFIMVDDVDKADVNSSLPTILGILTELKMHKTKTSLLLTANVVSTFDHGLLRPGRIDTWMTFNTPEAEERKKIMCGYMKEANVDVAEDIVDNFVRITADLTQDYLREIAQRLKYEEVNEIVETIMSMRKLLNKPSLDVKPEETKKDEKPAETLAEKLNAKSNGAAHA